jgi:hypothetical protein
MCGTVCLEGEVSIGSCDGGGVIVTSSGYGIRTFMWEDITFQVEFLQTPVVSVREIQDRDVICGDETYTMGMPLYRGFPVEVEAAPDQVVLTLEELLMQQFGRNSA